MSTTATERSCPFVGPRPFQLGEPFFGRDREVSKLLDLLIAERIVMLFSPSGAGKTSLIQAGLIPLLREEGFRDLPVIRVGLPLGAGTGTAVDPLNRYVRSVLASLAARPTEDQDQPEASLSHLDSLGPMLRHRSEALPAREDGRRPRLVLIFDQFEEVLTTDPNDRAAKEVFFDQLGAMLRDPAVWALIALREEYVAALEPYLNHIPRRLASRFRLDLLDGSSAREAFEKPFESRGISVADEAATLLVEDLRRVRVQQPDGRSEVVRGAHVEPVHLQIVGLRLWNRYGSDPAFNRLDETHLTGTESSVDAALAGYYADKMREIGNATDAGERMIREWCERQLITDQGLRGQVLREPGETRGLPEPLIRMLIDAFLVRAEERRGSTWYELAHDRLIEPVRKNNQDWRQKNLHPSLLRATDWDRTDQPDTGLLRGAELKGAEVWAETNRTLLTDLERAFLGRSRKLWDQEQSRLRTLRIVTMVTIVGLVTISLLIGYFWWQADRQRRRADQVAAESRRRTSELTIDRGISLCQQGRIDDGLLWLIRGLETNPRDPTLDQLARLELAAWQAEMTSLRWFQSHGDRVTAVAFSPDGRTALTGSADGTARLWEVATGQAKGPPLKHDRLVTAVTLSPDGHTALTGSYDSTARLWEVATGQAKGPPLKHDGPVSAVAFSPDGRTALTGSRDKTARLWDVQSQQPIGLPMEHGQSVGRIAFDSSGTMILISSLGGTAQIWLSRTQRPIGPPFSNNGSVACVSLSPDGRWIAAASDARTVQLWRTPTAVEGSPEKLALWVRVITRKELDQSGAVRSLDLEASRKDRLELERLGGPPDRPEATGSASPGFRYGSLHARRHTIDHQRHVAIFRKDR
ncbi:MAG: NACHT and WD repeat domain-containing protein [Isosphaerales bacterium]